MANAVQNSSTSSNLGFDPATVLDLNTPDADVMKLAQQVATDSKANPNAMNVFTNVLQTRQNRALTLSNLIRMLGDTARQIISNMR
jgi:hypothetical protein